MVERKPDPSALIEIAQKGFEATKVLFEKNLYSQAVYMLQRSLERASKAMEEELKEGMRHDVAKNMLKVVWRCLKKSAKKWHGGVIREAGFCYEEVEREEREASNVMEKARSEAFHSLDEEREEGRRVDG